MELRRILVVDDDLVILQSFRRAFENGLQLIVDTASTIACALDLVEANSPQLAIIDLHLGRDSGLELVRTFRAADLGMSIVLLSAYASVDIAVRAVKLGADEVLEKPITPREILARVRGVRSDGVAETLSADRALWEHVNRVLGDCHGNKSEAARRLRRPRSWLQRFLSRVAPAN